MTQGYLSKDVKTKRNRAQKKCSGQREQQVQKPWSRFVSACSGTGKEAGGPGAHEQRESSDGRGVGGEGQGTYSLEGHCKKNKGARCISRC